MRVNVNRLDCPRKQDLRTILQHNTILNGINCNFPDCDWFKKLLFSTYSLAKLLSDSSISQSHSKL